MLIRKGLATALGAAFGLTVLVILSGAPGGANAAEEPAGQGAFMAHKCNMCHAVSAAGIEATTKSESMKGADLGGKIEGDFKAIAAYVRKEGEIDGKTHKKGFKGTDEELQAIIDWLGSLEATE